MVKVTINGIEFYKAKASRGRGGCVGVSLTQDGVIITNTRTHPAPIEFSHREWEIFIEGVKKGEFDSFLVK